MANGTRRGPGHQCRPCGDAYEGREPFGGEPLCGGAAADAVTLPAREQHHEFRSRDAESLGQAADSLSQLKDAVDRCFVFGAYRTKNATGAHECVDGQQSEVRRRVDHDVVVPLANPARALAAP
jgi:hypothetical protein